MPILYHYTDRHGLRGILASGVLNPSTAQSSPTDVRHGEGQYLTDIEPGTMTGARLSRRLLGNPFQGQRYSHFIAIEVSGLNVVNARPGVYLIPNREPLDLAGRIALSGENHALPPG